MAHAGAGQGSGAGACEKVSAVPFELSLALAETAEVVVCDYNYVFDPVVRLKRFFDHRGSYALLIDEAHNLIPRAREMYSAELSAKDVRTLRREVGKCEAALAPVRGVHALSQKL